MACLYIIYSETTRKHYVGSSREDLPDKRLRSHNAGKTRSTKSGRPWRVIHTEAYETYTEARQRELFLKTGVGRKWIHEQLL